MPSIGLAQANVKRTRGRKLQRIRAQHFAEHPLCVRCQAKGFISLATQLDHIQALINGGKDDGPKQGLCAPCHKEKTAEDLGHTYKPKVTVGLDGWPIV